MIDRLVGWFAPHICEGCGLLGKPLCDSCNFDTISTKYIKCIDCDSEVRPTDLVNYGNMCHLCREKLPFEAVYIVGKREGVLKKLVGNFKYFSRRQSSKAVANLIYSKISNLVSEDLVIVYVPTAPSHIRERGFDHMKLVAKDLSRMGGWSVLPALKRLDNKSQHNSNRLMRQIQAVDTFAIKSVHSGRLHRSVLLIDDIYTTGSTAGAITKMLKKNGVKKVWLAVAARN